MSARRSASCGRGATCGRRRPALLRFIGFFRACRAAGAGEGVRLSAVDFGGRQGWRGRVLGPPEGRLQRLCVEFPMRAQSGLPTRSAARGPFPPVSRSPAGLLEDSGRARRWKRHWTAIWSARPSLKPEQDVQRPCSLTHRLSPRLREAWLSQRPDDLGNAATEV